MKNKCVVESCTSNRPPYTCITFPFPKITYNKQDPSQINLVSLRRVQAWKNACNLPDDFEPHRENNEARICSRHFITGRPAKKMNMFEVDWIPTLCLNGESEEDYEMKEAPITETWDSYYNSVAQENTVADLNTEDETIEILVNESEHENNTIASLQLVNTVDNSQTDTCTLIFDQETKNVIIVEANNDEAPSAGIAESEHIENMFEHEIQDSIISLESECDEPEISGKTVKSTVEDNEKYHDKPRILNSLNGIKNFSTVSNAERSVNNKSTNAECQTELTMKQIELMEAHYKSTNKDEENSSKKRGKRTRNREI